jgi:hypothetical protein
MAWRKDASDPALIGVLIDAEDASVELADLRHIGAVVRREMGCECFFTIRRIRRIG